VQDGQPGKEGQLPQPYLARRAAAAHRGQAGGRAASSAGGPGFTATSGGLHQGAASGAAAPTRRSTARKRRSRSLIRRCALRCWTRYSRRRTRTTPRITAGTATIQRVPEGLASATKVISARGQARPDPAKAAVDADQRTVGRRDPHAAISGTVTIGSAGRARDEQPRLDQPALSAAEFGLAPRVRVGAAGSAGSRRSGAAAVRAGRSSASESAVSASGALLR